MTVPVIYKAACADRKFITAIGIAYFEYRTGNRFRFCSMAALAKTALLLLGEEIERHAQVILGEVIIPCCFDGMPPKRNTIVPVPHLLPR